MANVIFKRRTQTQINTLPIEDGSVIFNTTNKDILLDSGTTRETYAGSNNTDAIFYNSMSMGRKTNTNVGQNSSALGFNVTASADSSHAEGSSTTANEAASHAEGGGTTASGVSSHAEGSNTTASGVSSHAEGNNTTASGKNSHAEGVGTVARGVSSHAEGSNTLANTNSHSEGEETIALEHQHAQGHYNNTTLASGNTGSGTSTGTAFVIGNGTSPSRSNAFRITGEGVVYSKGTYNTSGADYAEYCEWEDNNDNNEDRRGYFVTDCGLSKDGRTASIRKATSNDYIYGIVSVNPSIIGNSDEHWSGQYEIDEYGEYVLETKPQIVTVQEFNKETNKIEDVEKEIEVTFYKVNSDYDPTKQYTQREERKEWDAIGMLGILTVRDDGTCVEGGWCKSNDDGIATNCERGQFDTFRVVGRVNDNLIKVRIGGC